MITPRLAFLSALAVGACNTSGASPTTTAPAGTASPGQQLAAVSEGDAGPGPCGAEIGAYRRVMKQDIETGNVARPVHDQIAAELERAATACRAGRDGEARAIVASTKARFGYR